MQIIKIKPNSNGSHDNQTLHGVVPDGYAVIPNDMEIPDTFPFVAVSAEKGVVTNMEKSTVPETEPQPKELTQEERITALQEQLTITQEALDAVLMGEIEV